MSAAQKRPPKKKAPSSKKARPGNRALVAIEYLTEQFRVVIEQSEGARDAALRELHEMEARLSGRSDVLQSSIRLVAVKLDETIAIVRQNSEDIRKNSEDIRKNSEDIRKLSLETQQNFEDIRRLAEEIPGIRAETASLRHSVDQLALTVEAQAGQGPRIDSLETRVGRLEGEVGR